AMIHPIAGYTIKGAIWYQGESNVGANQYYNELFEAMIEEWRSSWNQGDFPFLFVQLANFQQKYDEPTESGWARLQEAQTQTLSLANTGMAVAID
ncbi:MAG TPA: sialate O-acetylesterase, partial [Balneolaceae bacterium]|nr:sialate O-acetylesterase [Balneolaceae bacterium]